MNYLLSLEVNHIIRKGTEVISGDSHIFLSDNEIEIDFCGLLWDGTAYRKLSEKYKIGDVVTNDIYDLFLSYMAIDERGLSDFIHEDILDLIEHDLMPQWDNMEKPVVFLMNIQGSLVWTDCGEEYDVEHHSVNVVSDFSALENQR